MRRTCFQWQGCAGRLAGALLAAAAWLVLQGATGLAASVTAEPSPYYLAVDPLPVNPARVVPRVLAFSVGPLATEVESTNWTFQDIANFAQSGDWQKLPDGKEELRFAGRGGITVAVLGAHLTVGASGAGTGSVNKDFVDLMKGRAGQGFSADLNGNFVRTATWAEAAVRASLPVPFLGNFLGLRGVRVGGGLHLLQGQFLLEAEGGGPREDPYVVSRTSRSGTGTAFDVGLAAELSHNLGVEVGYLGAGEIRWTDVKEETIRPSGTTPNQLTEVPYPLPATLYAGVRWRPMGPFELAASYARVGVNRPDQAFTRLNGEARFNLFFVRTALGAVQDENQPARLYARLGVGPLTLGLLNLEEAFKGAQGRSLGLSAQLSFGI